MFDLKPTHFWRPDREIQYKNDGFSTYELLLKDILVDSSVIFIVVLIHFQTSKGGRIKLTIGFEVE